MKPVKIISCILMLCWCALNVATAEEQVLWGKQIAGSGHMKNAKTEGNTVVLTAPAEILKVEGDTEDYCIWSAVTPTNRNAKAVLCGGTGRGQVVGKTLPAGSYRLIPGLGKKNKVEVRITLK